MLQQRLVGPEEVAADRTGANGPTSAAKTLGVIRVLGESERGMLGLTEVAMAMSVPKSTAHRLLRILELEGFVDRCGIKYRLGAQFFELAQSARWSVYGELRDLAAPVLDDLFDAVGATVHLGVLEGFDVLYVEKLAARGGTRIPSRVGARMPATCTSLGKAMLAHRPDDHVREVLSVPLRRVTSYSITDRRLLGDQLKQVRIDGVAFDTEESRLGLHCVASPIMLRGQVVAAVSAAGPTNRFSVRTAAPTVRAAAVKIGSALLRSGSTLGQISTATP